RKDVLAESTIEHVLAHPVFAIELDEIASDIRALSKASPNEATTAANFELKLYGQMRRRLNVEFSPIKEQGVNTARHVAKGRIDSRIGALILEYKQISALRSPTAQEKATHQLQTYLESLAIEDRSRAVGVLTDGLKIRFISIDEDGQFDIGPFETLRGAHLLRLIRGTLSLSKKALTPTNLISGFCSHGDPSIAKQLAHALYDAI